MPHRTASATSFCPALRSLMRATLASALLYSANIQAEPGIAWPEPAIPQGVETFNTGGQMDVNGMPLRMRGLLSTLPPARVAALFRTSLGAPLAENTQGAKLVLGRPHGAFYVTVQLEPAGAGTRGVLAVSMLSTSIERRTTIDESGRRIVSRFPANSRLVSRTSSADGKQRDEFLVLTNAHGVELNVEHIKQMLGRDGYTLVRENAPADADKAAGLGARHSGTTLLFKRTNGEASAVVFRDAGGNTAIAFNTVSVMEARP